MSVLVIGEALVDVVASNGALVEAPGGSPLNVAVGLGRLDVPVRLVTALGADPYGDLIRTHLDDSSVDVLAHPIARTSVARATLDRDGSATYDFEIDWSLETFSENPPFVGQGPRKVDFRGVEWVHVGSFSRTLPPGAAVVQELLARCTDAVVSYDPNCRPSLMDGGVLTTIEEQVAASDLVKLSDEDAAWLFPDLSLPEVAQRWLALGPQAVVVTLGAHGARAWTSAVSLAVPAAVGSGPVRDTVGAGDSFMAALIARLRASEAQERWTPASLEAALELATAAARITCERVGADPPRSAELGDGWSTHRI